MLRYKTDRTWFSRLVQYLARKWSGPIHTTRSPHGTYYWLRSWKKTYYRSSNMETFGWLATNLEMAVKAVASSSSSS